MATKRPARKRRLGRDIVDKVVLDSLDASAVEDAVSLAVTKRVVMEIEKEIGNSVALRGLIRGAMVKFVNGPEFEDALMQTLKDQFGNKTT